MPRTNGCRCWASQTSADASRRSSLNVTLRCLAVARPPGGATVASGARQRTRCHAGEDATPALTASAIVSRLRAKGVGKRRDMSLEVPQPSVPPTPAVPNAPVTPAVPDPGTPAHPQEPATVPVPQEPPTPTTPDPEPAPEPESPNERVAAGALACR